MRPIAFFLTLVCFLFPPLLGREGAPPLEIVLGNPDAPIKVYMYSSLTCGACAGFHQKVLPKIRKTYVDTGRVCFIMRPYPIDNASIQAAKLVYSIPDNAGRLALMDKLYSHIDAWAEKEGKALTGALVNVAKVGKADVDIALNNTPLETRILKQVMQAEKRYGVDASPTFIIGMHRFDYALSYEKFSDIIGPLLDRVQKEPPTGLVETVVPMKKGDD